MRPPASLGFIVSAIPGTPVQLSSTRLLVRHLRLQPRASATVTNVGNVYVGGANLTKGTPTTIFAILSPEQTENRSSGGSDPGLMDPSLVDLSQWYIDADNAGDGVLVGYLLP